MDLDFEPLDYYEATFGEAEVQIPLAGGSTITLERLGLGRFFNWQRLGAEYEEVSMLERLDVLVEWMGAAGVDAAQLELDDFAPVIDNMRALNVVKGKAAWQLTPVEESPEEHTDYPGRELAKIVDTLARHYGWDHSVILNLPPAAAMLYVQECVLAKHKDREWQWYLSEIAWEYNKASKKMQYREMPGLKWDREREPEYGPVPQHIIDKYYPKGIIIDLADPDGKEQLQTEDSAGRIQGDPADN